MEMLHRKANRRRSSFAPSPPDTHTIKWRLPPRQLCFWGAPQPHPHTNWFALFFDLIFVAAIFQLGTLLKYSLTIEGCAYFVTLFFSLMQSWQNKIHYDSRVSSDADLFHKIFDVVEAMTIAGAALHISGKSGSGATPLAEMNDLATSHAWGFSMLMCASRCMMALRWTEVYFEKETKGSTRFGSIFMKQKVVAALIYGAATVLSNSSWLGEKYDDDSAEYDQFDESSYSSYASVDSSSLQPIPLSVGQRFLESDSTYASSDSEEDSSTKWGSARYALLFWFLANLWESYIAHIALIFASLGRNNRQKRDRTLRSKSASLTDGQ